MKAKRPVNINVFKYRFPVPAIASILHRVTGVILFLCIPFMLWALQVSLGSAADFEQVRSYFSSPLVKFLIWGSLSSLFYHLFAGIRHMVMDMGYAESLEGGRLGAMLVIAAAILMSIMAGVWLW